MYVCIYLFPPVVLELHVHARVRNEFSAIKMTRLHHRYIIRAYIRHANI